MKRRICMAAVLMTALTMTACNMNEVPEITGTDYTVEAPVKYDLKDYKGRIENVASEALTRWRPTKENMVEHADVIVEGTVVSATYTSIGSLPWTQLDVVVNESYDGGLSVGDAISVYYLGGYMPLKEYYEGLSESGDVPEGGYEFAPEDENAMFHIAQTFEEAPEIGDTFLLPLLETESDALPTGVYEISAVGESAVYVKTGDGVYYCESAEAEWTVDELYTLIEERNAQALEF